MKTKYQKFPEEMSLKATGGPSFQTSIATSSNGNETRNINWFEPRHFFDVAPSVDSYEDLENLIDFFNFHKGKALPFRFKNWTFFKAADEKVEILNYETKEFKLTNKFIVESTLKLYSNGGEIAYELEEDNGVGRILDSIDENKEITASYEFDILCRFNIDNLKISLDLKQIKEIEIPVIEVRG